jgi:hypothetical protein
MLDKFKDSIVALTIVLAFAAAAPAQTAQPAGAAKAQPFDPHDLSGVYMMHQKAQDSLSKEAPPMTPWAQARYDANKPGIGRPDRITPLGNNPMMTCDPLGFPQIMFHTAYPVEIVQIPGRMFQFYDFFYTHRVIWTDGREVPKDPDPLWYGSSVGKWDGDTFVVDTVGFNDKSWLDADGHPHSEDMRVQERYHRVDHDTVEVNMTLTDPKAYTQPWVSETKVWKAAPKVEIREDICAPSDEEKYKEEMRVPAGTPTK